MRRDLGQNAFAIPLLLNSSKKLSLSDHSVLYFCRKPKQPVEIKVLKATYFQIASLILLEPTTIRFQNSSHFKEVKADIS